MPSMDIGFLTRKIEQLEQRIRDLERAQPLRYTRIAAPSSPRPVYRMKISSGGDGQKVVIAHFWDGETEGNSDTPVRVFLSHQTGEEIYAYQPVDGTGEIYNSEAVQWQEQIAAAGVLFAVSLTQTGGSNGDKTNAATWTYTVKTLGDIELATGKSPQQTRPNGTMTAATRGLAYYDADGSLMLAWAFETPGTGACAS